VFKKIHIISKPNDFTSEKTVDLIINHLKKIGCDIITDAKKAQLIIVVAGDGTLLNTARKFITNNIPIFGINLGRLGFLIDVSIDNMFEALDEVISGCFIEEKRMALSCTVNNKNLVAINDVVIHKHNSMRMIEFEIYVYNKFVNRQRSDGLIISSPTGSTAYSLSSGGPIMHPSLQAISLVSICPHTLSHRPIVLPDNAKIEIKFIDIPDNHAQIVVDGQKAIDVSITNTIHIEKNLTHMTLLHPNTYDYFEVVRTKLKWGEKL
jgi:NAD+ kinase